MITPLNFPKAELTLKRKDDQIFVWCIIRNKLLKLTPEEWVRQHLVHYLISEIKIPIAFIAAESNIVVNGLSRRCDVVVHDLEGKPVLLIECKAPEVKISENTFNQIAQYNSVLRVNYLMMTNGLDHFISQIDTAKNSLFFIESLPSWDVLSNSARSIG